MGLILRTRNELRRFLIPLCFFISLALSVRADAFLKIAGLPGESQAQGHQNEIDVLDWSWNINFPSWSPFPLYENFSITKNIDLASPKLMFACASGQIFTTATLSLRNPGQTIDFLVFDLVNVIVYSDQNAVAPGGILPVERITLAYERIRVTFNELDATGKLVGTFSFFITLPDLYRNAVAGWWSSLE